MPRPAAVPLTTHVATPAERERALAEWADLPQLRLTPEETSAVVGIGHGAYSPLGGFMGPADYQSVLRHERLADGTPWTIPVLLHVEPTAPIPEGARAALTSPTGAPLALLDVRDRHRFDPETHAGAVFGTNDARHPGVQRARAAKPVLLGGPVKLLSSTLGGPFPDRARTPLEVRRLLRERGFRTVAGYQTRNPPHRAHEFLHKLVLGLVDGLLIHPVVGRKKPGDFRDEVILDAYEAALASYYPQDRVLFSLLPYEMQYAGPKEAIHHAIVRRNYGCTHFIVGRDHAGVGGFYHPEEAIRKFEDFPDLGIEPLAIRGDHFWCHACGQLESERTCPHGRSARIEFSGSLIRDLLTKGSDPPPEVMRAEVFAAIRKHPDPFVR